MRKSSWIKEVTERKESWTKEVAERKASWTEEVAMRNHPGPKKSQRWNHAVPRNCGNETLNLLQPLRSNCSLSWGTWGSKKNREGYRFELKNLYIKHTIEGFFWSNFVLSKKCRFLKYIFKSTWNYIASHFFLP